MELLRGCGLDVMIKTSPSGLPLEQIEKVFLSVCTAMDYAHQQGVIHRDLKPENIFIVGGPREVGDVKVLDFGIAKLLEARRSRLTHTGMTLGTPRYLSPEQATGTHVDQRSDIYSLSVILFEALTGKELFQADSPYQYLMKHVYTIPRSLYEAAPERLFPREMDALLQKGLAKRSTDRPTSMSHLMTLLQDAFRSPLQQAPDKKAREQNQAGRYRIGHARSEHIGYARDERPSFAPKREMATPASSLPSASPRREAPRLPAPTTGNPKQRPPSYEIIERIPSHAPQMGGDTRLKTDSAEIPWVASPPVGQVSVEVPRISSSPHPGDASFEAAGFAGKASVELPRIGKASVELPKIGQRRPQELSQQPSSLLDTPTALTSTPSLLHRPPRKRGLSIEELPRITKEPSEGRVSPQALLTNRENAQAPPSRAIFELTTSSASSPLPLEIPKPDRRQLWLGLSFGALFTMLLLFILFFVLRL
jgi:serine/threonine protein kinase